MTQAPKNLLIAGLVLLLGLQIAIGKDATDSANDSAEQDLPLTELRVFSEVFTKVKNDYVESVDDKVLLENAIRGMLSGLDPHSAYLDAEAYRGLQEGTTGEFGGLGIEVGMEDGFVKVIAPIDDTPAYEAGIQAGDLIIRLDDTPVKGMTLNEAVDVMRGEPGTPIKLTIVREGLDTPLEIELTRAVIHVQSVRNRTLEPGFGYIRVANFQSHTGDDLREALKELKEANGGTLKGLVLDLRNNPGGILAAAVSVADAFIEKGLIVYTEGRVEDSKLEFRAKPTDLLKGSPIVVLVNGGTASASEIVAGALQDSQRGIIMGSQTFGKGSVQTILPMNNEAALKLTTARYYTPSGRSIQAQGISPDIVLDRVRITAVESSVGSPIKESNLAGHLENENVDGATESEDENEEQLMAESDYGLHEALNLLKGMALLQGRSRR
jgi:carboxyl-terminal processing protease